MSKKDNDSDVKELLLKELTRGFEDHKKKFKSTKKEDSPALYHFYKHFNWDKIEILGWRWTDNFLWSHIPRDIYKRW